MKIRLASPLQRDSVVDGTGIRTVIWTQGCAHDCPGCHNMGTHDFNGGQLFDLKEIEEEIDELEGQRGITFSGGDPLYQIDAVIELAKYINTKHMDIWVYTGFTFEQVLDMKRGRELLELVDVMVDGKFELKNRSLDAPFRGSTNQRIIDTKASAKEGKPVLIESLMKRRENGTLYHKKENVYI